MSSHCLHFDNLFAGITRRSIKHKTETMNTKRRVQNVTIIHAYPRHKTATITLCSAHPHTKQAIRNQNTDNTHIIHFDGTQLDVLKRACAWYSCSHKQKAEHTLCALGTCALYAKGACEQATHPRPPPPLFAVTKCIIS